jgi:hypothetical protein
MNNNDHLQTFLQTLKEDLIKSLQLNGKSVSAQTISQLVITENGDALNLQIPAYLQLLETGRGPTGKNAMPGNPPMIQRIQQWCRNRGIPDKAAWAIKKSIDKKGFKGIDGIISIPLSENNINTRLSPIMERMADESVEEILRGL